MPALAGKARHPVEAFGHSLSVGERVVLDVDGTDHDPAQWPDPDDFLPSRFAEAEPDPFSFVPQGGGDAHTGHRCPGEPLTVLLLAATVGVLASIDYQPVATSYDASRIPTLPQRRLVIRVAP